MDKIVKVLDKAALWAIANPKTTVVIFGIVLLLVVALVL